ncbi:MAG: hypothetical protein ABIJ18_02280 [archaeon]
MIVLNAGPLWFQGYDIAFNMVFAIITLLIAILSYKARNLTEDKKYAAFGTAFLLMSVSYLIFIFFALLFNTSTFINLLNIFDFVFFIHMLLMLLAYTLLIIVILKIKDRKIIALLLILMLLFVLFSFQYFIKFHIISFFLLAFLTYQFFKNHEDKKTTNTKLVFVSFFLLTGSHILFAAIQYSHALYIAGEVLQLLGFILLFLMFIKVVLHGRTKRKA